MSSMQTALINAGLANEEKPAAKSGNGKRNGHHHRHRKWKTARAQQRTSIVWTNELIGTVSFSVRGFDLGYTHSVNGVFWAQINVGKSTPKKVVVEFASNLKERVLAAYSKGGDMIDCAEVPIPALEVPVTWQEIKGNDVPHTRVKDMDNADLYLRTEGGEFIDLQVSILTRGGNFFLCVQELSTGQIIKLPDGTTKDQVGFTTVVNEEGTFTVIPLNDEYAYPGADFLKNVAPRGGPKFIELAAKDEDFIEASEFEVPEWSNIDYPSKPGWTIGGVVMWFNPIVGGKALCADGKECFIPIEVIENDHGRSEMRDGGFPVLVPLQQVLIRYRESEKGRQAADLEAIPVDE